LSIATIATVSRKSLIWIIGILVTTAILINVEHCSYAKLRETLTMESITGKIISKFKNIEHITTDDLANSLSQPGNSKEILLIDARTPAEFKVSHLPNAQNLQTVDEVKNHLASRATPPKRMVIYCSVGYRSADLASQLQDAKITDIPIQNLLGSIFSWANEGRPLAKADNRPAKKVHPFNSKWGRLLNEKYRADLTEGE
jgi:rhodanese-related sulfurtransferase